MAARDKKYLLLLRGVNVGGKGTISMAALKQVLEKHGFSGVSTYINSGNVLLSSTLPAKRVESEVQTILAETFKLDHGNNKVLVLTTSQLEAVVKNKPTHFGDDPKKYYSDVIFLIGISVAKTLPVFSPKEGVDTIWSGKGVIYSQRLGTMRTKSRLSKIMGSPLYKSMTIRTWGTTTKLLSLMK